MVKTPMDKQDQAYFNNKYALIKYYLHSFGEGDGVSVGLIQRQLSVGVKTGEQLLKKLHEDGLIESYESMAGPIFGGMRNRNENQIFFRIPFTSAKANE